MLSDPFFLLVVIGAAVTALVLLLGVAGFGRGGGSNAKRSNRLMRYRVIAQGVTVAFILLYVYMRRISDGRAQQDLHANR